jgi:hypothetical protein
MTEPKNHSQAILSFLGVICLTVLWGYFVHWMGRQPCNVNSIVTLKDCDNGYVFLAGLTMFPVIGAWVLFLQRFKN